MSSVRTRRDLAISFLKAEEEAFSDAEHILGLGVDRVSKKGRFPVDLLMPGKELFKLGRFWEAQFTHVVPKALVLHIRDKIIMPGIHEYLEDSMERNAGDLQVIGDGNEKTRSASYREVMDECFRCYQPYLSERNFSRAAYEGCVLEIDERLDELEKSYVSIGKNMRRSGESRKSTVLGITPAIEPEGFMVYAATAIIQDARSAMQALTHWPSPQEGIGQRHKWKTLVTKRGHQKPFDSRFDYRLVIRQPPSPSS